MRSTYHYRSFLWPALLILIGVIALLANTGQIPAERLYNLVILWPLILVVIGLELIVRRSLHGVAGDVARDVPEVPEDPRRQRDQDRGDDTEDEST